MNRRLFVGQFSVGFTLSIMSASAIAGSSLLQSESPPAPTSLDRAAELVQSGLVGATEQITISHIYNPNQVSKATLLAMAERDIERANRLVGTDLAINPQAIFNDSPSANFGSYSSRFDRDEVILVWQALPRIGHQRGNSRSVLRLSGSLGILEMDINQLSYQLVNFQGKIIRAENGKSYVASPLTRRGFLSV